MVAFKVHLLKCDRETQTAGGGRGISQSCHFKGGTVSSYTRLTTEFLMCPFAFPCYHLHLGHAELLERGSFIEEGTGNVFGLE